jgi:predicted transcriptional regulator
MGELPLSLRLDPQTREHLQREAHLRKTSEAEVAERIVKDYVNLQAQKREAIAAAITEADNGVFISSEAMHRWIES